MASVAEKIEGLISELQEAVNEYNKTVELQGALKEKIIATQGAINALKELEAEETPKAE